MVVVYGLALVVLCFVFQRRIPYWYAYAAGHLAVVVLTVGFSGAASKGARFFRAFDAILYIPVFFFMVCQLVHRVHPVDYDAQLIAIDRAIGGAGLLRAMGAIESPWLTRLAKVAWLSYYVIPFIPAIALYRRERPQAFEETKLLLVLGWLLSYAIYFLVPAEGPGYHEQEVGVAQPVWDPATSAAKQWIFALEGEARDTFPSGHVVIAALVIFVCLRHKAWVAAASAVPLALGVIASTLYLRYHYLVDVLAGLVLAALTAGLGIVWYRRYEASANS